MFNENILTASHATRLLYLIATCGAAAVGSWLYQSLFSLTVTKREIIASVSLGVMIYLFPVGMFLWHVYAALGLGLIFVFGFGLTRKMEYLDAQDRDDGFFDFQAA